MLTARQLVVREMEPHGEDDDGCRSQDTRDRTLDWKERVRRGPDWPV